MVQIPPEPAKYEVPLDIAELDAPSLAQVLAAVLDDLGMILVVTNNTKHGNAEIQVRRGGPPW